MAKLNETRGVRLTKEECYCSIEEFYSLVALKLGHDPAKVGYDCRKICVTTSVQNQIFAFYREQKGASDESIAMAWLNYGPKASLPYDGYFVEVSEGFFITEKAFRI